MNIKKIAVAIAGAFVINGSLTVLGHAANTSAAIYPNDFGPTSIDVSQYPPKMKMYYRLFLSKCSACHTIARPINSQYLELSKDEQAAVKKEAPEVFKNSAVWQVSEHIWSQYVHKMMSKPGSAISPAEGKKIWEFLAYDSRTRKDGANTEKWEKSRTLLLQNFKKTYPADYARLFSGASKAASEEKAPVKSSAQHS